MANRVTIRHKVFRFYEETEHPSDPDRTTLRQRIARMGETVEIPREEDYQRGLDGGAFVTKEDAEEATPEETTAPDLTGLDHEELVEYLQDNKPSAPQTVALASNIEDDEERAAFTTRLLEAEQSVTGRDPRRSVVDGLQRIIDDAEEEEV